MCSTQINESRCQSYTKIAAQTCASAATKSPDCLILAYRGTDSNSLRTYLWSSFTATHFGKRWGHIDVCLCRAVCVDELADFRACVFLPMTLLAKEALFSVAKPRSPIFTEPVGPVMKMLSHLRSLWIMGGALVCKKWRPLRICLHHERKTLIFITLKRFR